MTTDQIRGRVPPNFDLAGFLLARMYPVQGVFTEVLPQHFDLPKKLVFAPYSQIKADGQLAYPDLSAYPVESTVIHFYLDDWRFESAWRYHTEVIQRLNRYYAVIAPDFSVHYGAQLAPNLFNVYRNRLLTRHWQEYGLRVIYCLSWGFEDTFEYCFDGIPANSIVSVKSCSWFVDKDVQELWMAGFAQMCDRLEPKRILCCNKILPQALEYIDKQNYNISVIDFPHFWEAKRRAKVVS